MAEAAPAAPAPLATDEPLVAPAKPEVAAPAAPAEGVEAQKDGEQAPPAKPEDKPEEADTPERAAKREGRRFGKRLDAANRKYYEERARREVLEKQLNEVSQKAKSITEGAPKLEQFTTYEEFEVAAAKYHREEGVKEYAQKQQAEASKKTLERISVDWEKKAERGAEKHEDFDQVVGDLNPDSVLHLAIMKLENADDVAYYLGKNEKEARRIGSLDHLDAVMAIAAVGAKLLAEPPKPKTPSQAPAPIVPVGGKSGGGSDLPLDSDDVATWIKKEDARMRKQAGA